MDRLRSGLLAVAAGITAKITALAGVRTAIAASFRSRIGSARAVFERLRSRYPTALDQRIVLKLAAGTGVVALIMVGYAYGPALSQRSSAESAKRAETSTANPVRVILAQNPAPSSELSARAPIAPAAVAEPAATQSETARIENLVPVPEPANVPPPSRADLEREPKAERPDSTEARVPVPEPASQPAAEPAPAPVIASAPAETTQPESSPQPETLNIQSLTGKDLVKAPLATTLASADMPVAERLRDLLANRSDRLFSRKNERAAVEAFYRDRGFAPLWIEKGAGNARVTAATAHLKGVEADGLYPADYPTPDFKAAADANALAEAELRFTGVILTYARHAQTGRVHYSRISGDISYSLEFPEPAEILANMAAATNVGEALAGYNPPQAGYKALRAKLAAARGQTAEPEIARVPDGPTLKPAMEDSRVPILRKRLDVAGDPNDFRYDSHLVEAVKKFQQGADIAPDGLVGAGTTRALNGGPKREHSADVIIANLERWRWMPRDLGKVYVMVNIPDYTLKVVRDGALVWSTRIVVGKPNLATPIVSAAMQYITVNPTWNVPPSIIANEYLPALREDPQALTRIGLRVEENRDGTIRIYQPPGERNALGRIRFNFPNKFLVYQHDTPDKHLFAHDKRAYSHGCMRVQDPIKYGEVLLSIALPKEGYSQERLRRMFGSAEQDIRFPTPIPVHLTYQTAFVDDSGKLVIREDVYGRDARIIAALRGEERRIADIPIDRREGSSPVSRDALRMPGRYSNPFAGFFGRFSR